MAYATFGIMMSALFNVQSLNFEAFNINGVKIVLLALYVYLLRKYKLSPILIITISGIAGYIFFKSWNGS